MALQDVHVLLPGHSHVVPARPKGLCRCDSIKGFEKERLSWIIRGGLSVTPRVLIHKEEAGGSESEIRRCYAAGF